MQLERISETLQQMAEALAAVLQVQVDIVDTNLVRIAKAGTQPYRVGVEPSSGRSYRHALIHPKPLFIDKPRAHEVCLKCKERNACNATAEIVFPILYDSSVIGCIGLVAVDFAEQQRLLGNVDSLSTFISRISDLITSKIRELEHSVELASLAAKLESILHSASDGIMAIQPDHRIMTINPAALRMLGIKDLRVLDGSRFGESIRSQEIERALSSQGQLEDEPIVFYSGSLRVHCVGTVRPIHSSDGYGGIVCLFRTLEAVDRLAARYHGKDIMYTFENILGKSDQIQAVKECARRVAASASTVLLLGDTGTGKEIFARAIHSASPRASQPFVPVNCGAIPDSLLESELFGYNEGAFTGARRGGKPGKFELASGGTLFLDEIGDMPLHMQAKLLRALEEGIVERLGGTRPIQVNVRVIAATNRDLSELVNSGGFRRDLYYRLNVVPIRLPLLRERPGDIEFLAEHFLRIYSRLHLRDITGITPEAIEIMKAYPWPGNVRELQNAMEYAVNVENTNLITPASLRKDILNGAENKGFSTVRSMAEIEGQSIRQALKVYGNDTQGKRRAARALGIHLSTLYRKLKSLGNDS